ncbi:MAG: hypothetical protein IPN95_26395 [Bacteroidetes bacterium]|nr:hypothetical protein [Bacteroidota bacterium]
MWQSQGSGDVNVGNGICNFANVYSGSYNRVYQATSSIFPDNYWRADFDFSILNPNAYGGVGEVLLALTAGPLDFISYDLSQGYLETTQDGIAVILHSDNANDNDINHWYFIIEGKKGSTRLFDVGNVIHANAAISDYYIRLERSSYGLTQLSICTDQNYTNHLPGSPVTYAIDPTITGLNHVQHGTSTPGTPTRNINAKIDNDFICGDRLQPTAIDPSHDNDGLLVFPNPSNTTLQVTLKAWAPWIAPTRFTIGWVRRSSPRTFRNPGKSTLHNCPPAITCLWSQVWINPIGRNSKSNDGLGFKTSKKLGQRKFPPRRVRKFSKKTKHLDLFFCKWPCAIRR